METVAAMIKKVGGEVTRHENLARLKLAYTIERNHHGVYVLAHFKAEPTAIADLDRQIRMSDEVIRHQLAVMPTGADKKQYKLTAYVAPLTDEGRPTETRRASAPAKSEDAPADMETLTKKMDAALEDKQA
jgi:ribosomal protein S6